MTDIEATIEQALYPTEEEVQQPVPRVEIDPNESENLVLEPEAAEEVETEEAEAPVVEEEIESMASVLGLADDQVKVTDEGAVVINAVIDGESVEVPLSDLVASYQGTQYNTKQADEVIQQKAELETAVQQIQQATQQKLQQMQTVSKLMEKELLSEYNQQNWDELSRTNPQEYHRQREMYSAKAQRIKGIQEQFNKEGQEQQQQRQEYQQQKMQQLIVAEQAKVLAANPTWHNQQVKDADMANLRSFLSKGYGYSDEEISMITDSRLVHLIQDAYKAKSPQQTTKKKQAIPTFQKSSGGGRTAAAANARAVKARRAALKKSGSNDALAKVLIDRM
jgi:hypothetical protein